MNEMGIDSLKQYAGMANAIYFLQQRCKQLEEMIGLRGSLIERIPMRGQCRVILSLLYAAKGATCSQKFIYDALFGGRMLDADLPGPKVVDVQICRLRKALNARGISIGTAYGHGWYLDDANRAKIDTWLEELS